jgi:hypothetical protein
MAFFRQYIAPLIILLGFVFALVAVSARSFLPDDMLAPAALSSQESPVPAPISTPISAPTSPISQVEPSQSNGSNLPPQLSQLVHGDAPAL